MTSTWLWTSASLICYLDRLNTLKVGGSKSKGDRGKKRREERGRVKSGGQGD